MDAKRTFVSVITWRGRVCGCARNATPHPTKDQPDHDRIQGTFQPLHAVLLTEVVREPEVLEFVPGVSAQVQKHLRQSN